jgi:hypothetical protein
LTRRHRGEAAPNSDLAQGTTSCCCCEAAFRRSIDDGAAVACKEKGIRKPSPGDQLSAVNVAQSRNMQAARQQMLLGAVISPLKCVAAELYFMPSFQFKQAEKQRCFYK